MRKTALISVQIDKYVLAILMTVCKREGYRINRFVERAIRHAVEEELVKNDIKAFQLMKYIPLNTCLNYKKAAKKYGINF